MKVKISAGAEIDTLTKDELRGVLKDWMVETMRGAIPTRFDAWGTVAANALTIDGQNGSGQLGPEAGMFWYVTRLAVVGLTNATDPTSVYINNVASRNLLVPSLSGVTGSVGYHEFQGAQCLLTGNDRLILASTGSIAATGNITFVGAAWELPIGLLWKLLG